MPDTRMPEAWRHAESEIESEPDDARRRAQLVLCTEVGGPVQGFVATRCSDWVLNVPVRFLEDDACASGPVLIDTEPGTAHVLKFRGRAKL